MLKHPDLTSTRIEQFLNQLLEPMLYGESSVLRAEFCGEAYGSQQEAQSGEFVAVDPGFRWGPAYRQVWFRLCGSVPRSWAGQEVVARLNVGGERTVWKGNSPIFGVDGPHQHYRIAKSARGGERIELYVQAYANNPEVRIHGIPPERKALTCDVGESVLSVFDTELWQFYLDCKFAFKLMKSLPAGTPAREHLLRGLNDAINLFDPQRRQTLLQANKAVREASAPKLTDRYHQLTPVGHAHLDTAWLWPVEITQLKFAHTASTQLALMDEYPEYVFVHSQPAQYEWLEKRWPKLFERVKDKVASGQWEPVGSMWVESDMNLPGGESLVRQLLYGKRYFAKKFNIETKDLWLPDVFGYSAALPQLLAKSGVEYFLTQKISWNQFNRFPHNTFWWQGIDGTKIWSHFPPADTYNGNGEPGELQKHLTQHRDHARSDHGLYIFGHGDGGGGPTAEMIEMLRRGARGPGLPEIEWQKAIEFFEEAKAKSQDLPTWSGELYFELHRGTYTSQANNKKMNRTCEFLLRDLELISCFDTEFPGSYPQAQVERLWKTVLLNQFHDIIPGSSVTEVYEDSAKEYADVVDKAQNLLRERLERIATQQDTSKFERPVALFQFAETVTEAKIKPPKGETPQSIVCQGEVLPVQSLDMFGEKSILFQAPEAALGGVVIGDLKATPAPVLPRLVSKNRRIENEHFSVRFDGHGNITSVVSQDDNVEFIEPGSLANQFQIFEDKPTCWSAWDVDIFALETQKNLVQSERFEVVEKGPVRVAMEIEKQFGKSRIIQRISLGPTPGIRFDTQIDWHETEKMLKVAFPINVNATKATCEIQFGNVERPTHRNTSWDMAKFEICAQKWIDISEGDHGAALINDGKYGHDVLGNTMRMTLLRAPKAPDPTCDMGTHRFTYVLLPHFGAYNWSGVVQAGYALNAPMRYRYLSKSKGEEKSPNRLIACDDRNLVVEAVKKSEDSKALIVRLYECHNARGSAELSCGRRIKAAFLCDLLENELEELQIENGAVQFDYKPFEIITIKLIT